MQVASESPRYRADPRISFGLSNIVLLTSLSTSYFDKDSKDKQV